MPFFVIDRRNLISYQITSLAFWIIILMSCWLINCYRSSFVEVLLFLRTSMNPNHPRPFQLIEFTWYTWITSHPRIVERKKTEYFMFSKYNYFPNGKRQLLCLLFFHYQQFSQIYNYYFSNIAGEALGIRLELFIENRSNCSPTSENCGNIPWS